MHARLQEVIDIAEQTRAELLGVLGTLTPSQWEAAEADNAWTTAQIVTHLHMVESSSVRALFRTLRDAVRGGTSRREDRQDSVAGSMDHYLTGIASGPMVAPAFIVPPRDVDPPAELQKLETSREGLMTWAAEADGIALGDLTFPHPIMGPLNLYQWPLFLALHERRHLGQIKRNLAVSA